MLKRDQYSAVLLTMACIVALVLSFQVQGFGEQAKQNHARMVVYQNELKVAQVNYKRLWGQFKDTQEDRTKWKNTAVIFCGRWLEEERLKKEAEALILAKQKARYEKLKADMDKIERSRNVQISRGKPRSMEPVGTATGQRFSGKASYYSVDECGTATASERPLNDAIATCAHKTLTFGTRLKITNRDNEKSVVAEVTDRGPFAGERVLDLSVCAFQAIANLSTGVIMVDCEVM